MEGVEAALRRIKEYSMPRRKRLLVVEDNPAEQLSISELLGYDDVEIETAGTGREALAALRRQPADCVVLDLRLPDMTGFEVLEELGADQALSEVPVVVFTGRQLSAEEDARLHTMARSIVVKGVESPERLLDETALFLHRVVTDLPAEKQRMLERLTTSDEDLVDRTALLVDDDARNIFALSSVLERRGMRVLSATTGNEAICCAFTRCCSAGWEARIAPPAIGSSAVSSRCSRPTITRSMPICASYWSILRPLASRKRR
jgi:CheY-like chemotaxis protein